MRLPKISLELNGPNVLAYNSTANQILKHERTKKLKYLVEFRN